MRRIQPSDRERYKALWDHVLEAAHGAALDGVEALLRARPGRQHGTFQELIDRVCREKRRLARMFDGGLRRSTMVIRLAEWYAQGLIAREDLAGFSEETRRDVARIAKASGIEGTGP